MKRFLLLLALASTGCWEEPKGLGDGELFRVRTRTGAPAQFVKGPLPGRPLDPGVTTVPPPAPVEDGGTPPAVLPEVISLGAPSGAPFQGSAGVPYSGTATLETVSFGLFLEGISTGYWVLPVEDQNPAPENTYNIGALIDYDRAIPSKRYRLLSVGFDADNRSGPIRPTGNPCIASEVPDGFSGCSTKVKTGAVPEAVISLKWDANVDLDLQVRTPEGRIVDPKHPTELPAGDSGVVPTTSAQIDRDSNANCTLDGVRTENLVWSAGNSPPPGLYTIYANLFDACKQASVRFTVTVYTKQAGYADGGDLHIEPVGKTFSGELLDFQANGGSGLGLFVTQVKF